MRIAICAGHHESARGAVNEKYMCNEHDEAVLVVEHMRSKLFEQGHYAPVFGGSLRDKITAINDRQVRSGRLIFTLIQVGARAVKCFMFQGQ